MSNKYLEALNFLSQFEKPNAEEFGKDFVKVNTNILQELVDKETPMRVLVEVWDLSSTDEKDILCPKCNALLGTTEEHYESNYCYDCGQRLDWSDE